MVRLDIERTFDTIWHDGLIFKLSKMDTQMIKKKLYKNHTIIHVINLVV